MSDTYDYDKYRKYSSVQREEIQEKVYEKWMNFRLRKASMRVENLFEDLRDGRKLLLLVEELSGEKLPMEYVDNKSLMNIQAVLNYLCDANVFLGTITAEEIMRGDRKAILELLWRIILHLEIGYSEDENEDDPYSGRKVLMNWVRSTTARYFGVLVSDFGASWRDGRAFNALLHRNRPDLLDWSSISILSDQERLNSAFVLAERKCGVPRLLEPEDVDMHEPDEKSLMTYVALMRKRFPCPPEKHPLIESSVSKKENSFFFLSNGAD